MSLSKAFLFIFFIISCNLFADYQADTNSDGTPDVWVTEYEDGSVLIESDTDFNGIKDSRLRIDSGQLTVFEETDYNRDGKMDNYYYYENGVVVRQEVDSNYDGNIDLWIYVQDGEFIVKYEKDTDFDGKIDVVKEFGD